MTTKINADRYNALKEVVYKFFEDINIYNNDEYYDLKWEICCHISFVDSKKAIETAGDLQSAATIVNFLNNMHINVTFEDEDLSEAVVDKNTWFRNFKADLIKFLEAEDYVTVYELLTM